MTPEATAEDVSRIEAALLELPGKIPAIKDPEHVAVIDNLIAPILAKREAVRYVID